MDINGVSQGGQLNLDYYSSSQTQKTEIKTQTEDKKVFTDKDVKKAVEKLNKLLEDEGTHAEYKVHDKFKHDIMVKIIDNKTKEVILEVPPKKVLDLIARMVEETESLFDKKA